MPDSIEHIARTLYALMIRRAVERGIIAPEIAVCFCWEDEQEACREDWRAVARAVVAADLCPDKSAMIEKTRAALAELYAKRAEIDDLIGYGEEFIAALEQANAKSTIQ